jgi:hypothetical protein
MPASSHLQHLGCPFGTQSLPAVSPQFDCATGRGMFAVHLSPMNKWQLLYEVEERSDGG